MENRAFLEEFATRLKEPNQKKVILEIVGLHDKYEENVKRKKAETARKNSFQQRKDPNLTKTFEMLDKLDEQIQKRQAEVFKRNVSLVESVIKKEAEKIKTPEKESVKDDELDLSPIKSPFGEDLESRTLDDSFAAVDDLIENMKKKPSFFSRIINKFRRK